MKIDTYIDALVSYAMNCALAEPEDHQVITNRLLDLLHKEDYEPSQEPLSEGQFVTVQIDGCIDGDLSGYVLEEE